MFIDFDETITEKDTLSLIAPPDGDHPGPPFAHYSRAYMDDLRAHDEKYDDKKRQTIEKQLRYLQSLDDVELVSQKRIEEGGLFVGFDPAKMEKRAKKVSLRVGWREAMATPEMQSIEKHIISVGWSARFIESALDRSTKPTSICANEIEIDADTGLGTGRLTKSRDSGTDEGRYGIRIAQDKTREMKRILKGREGRVLTVFAGDSNTDLPSLLESDIGLILGDNKGIRETIERLGLGAELSYSVEEWKQKRRSKPSLVAVGDWYEAAKIISELHL